MALPLLKPTKLCGTGNIRPNIKNACFGFGFFCKTFVFFLYICPFSLMYELLQKGYSNSAISRCHYYKLGYFAKNKMSERAKQKQTFRQGQTVLSRSHAVIYIVTGARLIFIQLARNTVVITCRQYKTGQSFSPFCNSCL